MNMYIKTLMAVGLIVMFIFPGDLQPVKFFILANIVIYSFAYKKISYNKKYLLLTLVIAVYGLICYINGIINGNLGANDEFKLFIMWPAVGYILAFSNWSDAQIKVVAKCFHLIILYAMAHTLFSMIDIFLNGSARLNDVYEYIIGRDYFMLGINDGRTDINVSNINFLIFTSLYMVAMIINNAAEKIKTSWVQHITHFGLLLIMMMSGRRAWYIAYLVTMIISSIFFYRSRLLLILSKLPIAIVAFFILLYSAELFGIELQAIILDIGEGFEFDSAYSAVLRKEQYIAMLSEFYKSPILGHGLGYVAVASIRNAAQPWQYELSYLKILMCNGLIGFLLYAFSIGYVLYKLLERKEYSFIVFPVLGYLLCNATNPYLYKFDDLYVIFLPLALYYQSYFSSNKKASAKELTKYKNKT